MTDLLLTILLMSLVCCGAHVVINDDIIGDMVYKKEWWMRPLWTCCRCMASVWGGLTFGFIQFVGSHPYNLHIREIHFFNIGTPLTLLIPAIIATAFLNSVFINYYYKHA